MEFRDDFPNSCELRALVEKPARSGLHAETTVLRIGVIGEYDEQRLRKNRMHRPEHIDACAVEQPIIEHDAVGASAENAGDRDVGTCGFADQFRPVDVIEQLDQPVADRNGVFDDEYLGAIERLHGGQYSPLRRARPSAAADCGCRACLKRYVGRRRGCVGIVRQYVLSERAASL